MSTSKRPKTTIGIIEVELMKLVRHLETFGRRSSLDGPLDRSGYLALRSLALLGPTSPQGLARALHLDASTITRQVATLKAAGFVRGRPDPVDRRSSILELTDTGGETVRHVEQERRQRIEALMDDWTDAERGDLARTLAKLNNSLVGAIADNDGHPRLTSPVLGEDR